jgi:hypothetical protein
VVCGRRDDPAKENHAARCFLPRAGKPLGFVIAACTPDDLSGWRLDVPFHNQFDVS